MRYASLILFVLVLVTPFALRRGLAPEGSGSALRSTSVERLVVITPHNPDIRKEFGRAFREWHLANYNTEVELDFRVPGGTNDIQRQLETTYKLRAKTANPPPPDISVVWGGGDYFFNQLKKKGILWPIQMTPALLKEFHEGFPQPVLAGVQLYDDTKAANGSPTPQWIGVCLSSFGICYNPDVYRSLNLPEPSVDRGWSELTNPRLHGLLALADPSHSESASVAYQMVIQHKMAEAESAFLSAHPELQKLPKSELAENPEYRKAIADGWHAGMGELLKIAANARYFTDSSTMVPMDVSRGESAAGIAIDFYARVTEESAGSDRMRYVAPTGATAITPDPVAILAGTTDRKLELAQHFLEFLLSPAGQRLWILKAGAPGGPVDRALRRPPIRQDVYANRAGWADSANPFTDAHGFNERGEWMALFKDTRPIWVAAWIDSRDALRDAYSKILMVPDADRRAILIDRLADLPVTMTDIELIANEAAAAPDLDLWRAKHQMDWAKKFRKHYRAVADEAR